MKNTAPTAKELQEAVYGHSRRKSKYGVADKEFRTADGIVFHSRREMLHYATLKTLERAGKITQLKRQVPFVLHSVSGLIGHHDLVPITKLIADFTYIDDHGLFHVVDCKGFQTALSRIQHKWFNAEYAPLRIETA